MGVVFFPSLPFVGVMLFPSFRLGNAPGEGGASLALFSLFFILLLPPLFFLSSSLFFLSSSLFSLLLLLLFHLFFFTAPSSSSLSSAQNLSIPFSSSPAFHIFFHICFSFFSFLSFSPFPLFCLSPLSFASFSCLFFFGGTACTVCFQDVGDDATYCNPIVIRL